MWSLKLKFGIQQMHLCSFITRKFGYQYSKYEICILYMDPIQSCFHQSMPRCVKILRHKNDTIGFSLRRPFSRFLCIAFQGRAYEIWRTYWRSIFTTCNWLQNPLQLYSHYSLMSKLALKVIVDYGTKYTMKVSTEIVIF